MPNRYYDPINEQLQHPAASPIAENMITPTLNLTPRPMRECVSKQGRPLTRKRQEDVNESEFCRDARKTLRESNCTDKPEVIYGRAIGHMMSGLDE